MLRNVEQSSHEHRQDAVGMLGFHFRFQLRVDWRGLVGVFNERARLLGCTPQGESLRPRADRLTVSGTIDLRLRYGARRYDFVLYSLEGRVIDVQLGLTEDLGVRFGVDPPTRGEWCSNDTLGFSAAGLFIPEQRTADNTSALPATFVAQLQLWDTLSALAVIATGGPVTAQAELPSAPGWEFVGAPGDHRPELRHPVAGLSFIITPMMT